MVNHLEPKPVAIILSGFDRWYENLPMFEFNGEYELIRESNILSVELLANGKVI